MTTPSSTTMLLRTLARAVLLAGAAMWFAAGTVWAFYLPLPSSPKPRLAPPPPAPPPRATPRPPPPAARPVAVAPRTVGAPTALKSGSSPPIVASPVAANAMPTTIAPATASAAAGSRVAVHPPLRPKSRPAHAPRR